MNKTKHARIFVGTSCNARCGFCYYVNMNNRRNTEDIKRQMDIACEAGMKAIDFSGGEPSLIPEIVELTRYACSKGMWVGMVTNGIRLSDDEFVRKLVIAGMDNFLFSVHGHDEKEHDHITGVEGSFENMIDGIKNVKSYECLLRINCTVTKANYKNLEKHAELYLKLEPYQVNFILFNDWETADSAAEEFCVRYSEAAPYIKKAIDIMGSKIPIINVRYIPYCFMKGYEKHVCDYSQKIYDPFEWSQKMLLRLDARGIWPMWKYWGYLLYGDIRFGFEGHDVEDIAVNMRRATFIKPPKCKACKYYELCDGLEKSYFKINGGDELMPEGGEKIKDVMFYRRDFY